MKPISEKTGKSIEGIKKIKTGITGFDKLLTEGIPSGSSVLVEGGPGCGKTIFCLQVSHNLSKKGYKVLYMSFEEATRRLISHMKDFNWEPEKLIKKNLLRIERFSPIDVARSVEALLSEAKRELLIEVKPVLFPKDFKPDIVCIDSLSSISSAFSGEPYRFRIYMEQLFKYLEKENITSFLIRETIHPVHTGTNYIGRREETSFLSDGIISLYSIVYKNGERGRALEIVKMRGENIKRKIALMKIVPKKGIIVYPNKTPKGDYIIT